MRDQIQCGLGLADKFMEKRSLVLCTDKGQRDSLSGTLRRMMQDAKFDGLDNEKVHHVGYCDLSRWGRLSVPQIDDMADWTLRTLQLNPDYSNLEALTLPAVTRSWLDWLGRFFVCQGMVLIICPMLAGEGVLNGLRGEFRQVIKLVAKTIIVTLLCVFFWEAYRRQA